MSANPLETTPDVWSHWLLRTRSAGNEAYDHAVRAVIERYADHVLNNARLAPSITLADIGAGDGLIAFRAIDRVGPSLQAILTDVSQPLLDHARTIARERGVVGQCNFVNCSADKLKLRDSSIDIITTRAVLAYVADKPAAMSEFFRVLKPGGRLSIGEPIFQDQAFETISLRNMLSVHSSDKLLPLLHRWKSAQFPDTPDAMARSPIANFSERDLLRFAHAAGFSKLHLEMHIDVLPSIVNTWDVFLDISPHPWAPPLRQILSQQFSPAEREYFESIYRPTVETRPPLPSDPIAYLSGSKPQ